MLQINSKKWYNKGGKSLSKNGDNKSKKYNLKNDIIFKAFFARKGNEIFLIDFLEALLNIKIKAIKINEEVNLEQLSVDEKGGRLDYQKMKSKIWQIHKNNIK